jgi:hypothetical protein
MTGRSRRRVFWWSICLSALSTSAAAAPERRGFTGDLSLGFSLTTRTAGSACYSSSGQCPPDPETEIHLEPGFAPLGVSLGGYFTPRIALLFRLAGTSYFRANSHYLHTFAGPVLELWPHDRWFVAGGVGLGTFAPNPLFGPSVVSSDAGLAFDARVGAVLLGGVKHALTVSLEVIPALYRRPRTGAALLVAWKWY